jgi:hypothetical protein
MDDFSQDGIRPSNNADEISPNVRALIALLDFFPPTTLRSYALRFKIDPTVLSQYDVKKAIARELDYQGYYAAFNKVSDLDKDQQAPELQLPDIEMYTTVSDEFLSAQGEDVYPRDQDKIRSIEPYPQLYGKF